MSNTIILLKRAERELKEAWNWYEEKKEGLGNNFQFEVFEKIKIIEQYPERYSTKYHIIRETKIKRFPYLIVYRYLKPESTIVISSIFHTSRNPAHKYDRS